MLNKKFPFYHQLSEADCGPSCIRTIAKFYGKKIPYNFFDKNSISREGISIDELMELAKRVHFDSLAVKINTTYLEEKIPLPCIIHWNQNHFSVLYKIQNNRYYVSDPAFGRASFSKEEFEKGWLNEKSIEKEGIAIILKTEDEFYSQKIAPNKPLKSLQFIKKYFFHYKYHLVLVLIGLLLSSISQFLFPFITKAIVDYAVEYKSVEFLVFILFFEIMLFLISIGIEFLRGHLLLNITKRINILIISDFLIKILKLPISFFSSKIIGDLMQRIKDHERVDRFISTYLLRSVFSVFSVLVFCSLLFYFNYYIFGIYVVGLIIELFWIFHFMGKIKTLDYKSFSISSEDQNKVLELLTGIQEIKLNNIEDKKRWEWEDIQLNAFKISSKRLSLNQIQEGGQRFFSYVQIISITFVAAYLTITGNLSIGTFVAIIFILGQLDAPIGDLINFILQGQLALISLDRLNDIHKLKDESEASEKLNVPNDKTIYVKDLNFSYNGSKIKALDNMNFTIPEGSVTAIVGESGSGKTTFLKQILKFFNPTSGEILIGNKNLNNLDDISWRDTCGAVMQDGFIFSDTIANNIALDRDNVVNIENLNKACIVANIKDFIESLPMKFDTKIGQYGVGLSQGQKQRLLIARAVYKNPDILLFDEATNALDTENEKVITNNLAKIFENKTVIIVAHRLSTVINADQILVFKKGEIIERGKHSELVAKKGVYFKLIKNQLELSK